MAVVIVSQQIGAKPGTWTVPAAYVQGLVLGFGGVLFLALTIALYKYRLFKAAVIIVAPNSL